MKIVYLLVILASIYALDNGVAVTPPMGWMSWERFACEVDCDAHPDSCINEKLITETIDKIVDDGYLAAGYDYVNIDDCWESMERDEQGRLYANTTRFPHGMKWLVEYANKKGVKLGTYTDYGTKTCGGYPGTKGHIEEDAQTFAEWGIDNLKVDGCYASQEEFKDGYTNLSIALNKTGRPIVYACSWPAYDKTADFRYLQTICNLWRPWYDIYHSWYSVSNIITYWGDNQTYYAFANRPGSWVDPDMLVIGNPGDGLGLPEYRSQMALWAMFTAPLYMGNDVRNITKEEREILLNTEIIAVDQDKAAIAGRMYFRNDDYEVWMRPLDNGDYAVALYNRGGSTLDIKFDPHYVGLNLYHKNIVIRDLWKHEDVATLENGQKYTQNLVAHDTAIYRIRYAEKTPAKKNNLRKH